MTGKEAKAKRAQALTDGTTASKWGALLRDQNLLAVVDTSSLIGTGTLTKRTVACS
jgi:hypothetical protein